MIPVRCQSIKSVIYTRTNAFPVLFLLQQPNVFMCGRSAQIEHPRNLADNQPFCFVQVCRRAGCEAPACWILLPVRGGRKRPALRQTGRSCDCAERRQDLKTALRGRGKPLPYGGIRSADLCRSGRTNICQFNLIILRGNDQIETRDDQIERQISSARNFSSAPKEPVGATCGRPCSTDSDGDSFPANSHGFQICRRAVPWGRLHHFGRFGGGKPPPYVLFSCGASSAGDRRSPLQPIVMRCGFAEGRQDLNNILRGRGKPLPYG